MDLDKLLQEEADAMFDREAEMKKKLDEYRRVSRMSAPSWQECLTQISFDPAERRRVATTVEADAQRPAKRRELSRVYVQGSKVSSGTLLAKLLLKASLETKVTLPKKAILDLEKSGLPQKFSELLQKQQGGENKS